MKKYDALHVALDQLRKMLEQVEGRRIEEIGLPTKAFARVVEELKIEPAGIAPSFNLHGVRAVSSFESVVSFIFEDRVVAEVAIARAKAQSSPEHQHHWRKDAHRGATGYVCGCGATR